ncbi:MAG: glyoxylate/hydroxypyruvate reductase A [Alphaproteobacteria bacterium]|nr:glyoxylate/hydroxypyruvate reductase A [Alphaproteobacteria bacterium]
MVLMMKSGAARIPWWLEEFKRQAPDLQVRVWPDVGDKKDVEFAFVWAPDPGDLKTYTNLKAIFSMGAGVDHLFKDPDLPNLPITRVVDINMTRRMTEFIVLQVLRHHRQQPAYDALQREGKWQELKQPAADQRIVGILGMGTLGSDAAKKLSSLGFNVVGWSRTKKKVPKVKSYAGLKQLNKFLSLSEILVCLLPLTKETENVLNKDAFAMLPKGASLVNAGRGEQVVDADLIEALDSGHMSHATLDVFRKEPLPADHPYWSNPKVTVMPHVASYTDPRTVVSQVLENMRRARAGEPLLNTVDIKLGY